MTHIARVLCRSWSQFQKLDQIGSGHASVVHLVWDKAAHTYLAVKCYKGAALLPDTAKQVCCSNCFTKRRSCAAGVSMRAVSDCVCCKHHDCVEAYPPGACVLARGRPICRYAMK